MSILDDGRSDVARRFDASLDAAAERLYAAWKTRGYSIRDAAPAGEYPATILAREVIDGMTEEDRQEVLRGLVVVRACSLTAGGLLDEDDPATQPVLSVVADLLHAQIMAQARDGVALEHLAAAAIEERFGLLLHPESRR